jgi:hypothetical protein
MTKREMLILLGFIVMAPVAASRSPTVASLFGVLFLVLSRFEK